MADETSTPPQENFASVIEKVTKRPSGGKPKEVLAVQIVDKAGKHAGPGSKGGTRLSDEAAETKAASKDAAKVAVEQTVLLEDIADATETSAEQPIGPEAEQTASPEESEEDKAEKIALAEATAENADAIRDLTKDSLRGSNRLAALTEEGLEGREEEKRGLKGREEQLKALQESIEKAGGTAEDSKKYNKMQYELKKDELALRLKNATTPAARKQIRQEQKALAKEHGSLLGKMASGLNDMKNKMLEPVKGAGKGIMAMLKGTLIAGALLAVVGFLNSEYWKKTKKFIVDDVVPVLMDLYENILKPIGVIFADTFVKTWENIKALFTDLGEAFSMFQDGDYFGGITKIITSIGSFLGNLLDTALTSLWNIIATIFGLEETDSIWGSIKSFFDDIYTSVVTWISSVWKSITDLFSWGKKDEDKASGGFSLFGTIFGVIDGVITWIKQLFSDPLAALKTLWTALLEGYASLMDLLWSPVKKAIAWVMRLFGWDEAAAATEKFSIKTFILGIFDTVKKWIVGLFTWGKKTGTDASGTWSLKTFISGVWITVKEWFTNLFSWASTEDDKDSFVVKTIKTAVDAVKTWLGNMFNFSSTDKIIASAFNAVTFLPNLILTGLREVSKWLLSLFGFDDAAEKLANTDNWTIGSMIVDAFKAVKEWIVDLFTWGKKAGETTSGDFSLVKMITETITNIWDWFKNLLDIDVMAIAKKIPGVGKLISWFSGDSKSKEDIKKEADEKQARITKAKTAAAEKRAGRRTKGIEDLKERIAQQQLWLDTKGKKGKEFQSGSADWNKGDIQDQKEIMADDNEKLKKLIEINERQNKQDEKYKKAALEKGSIFTHDQGLHDRLDRIFPPENNVERTKQMKEASLAKGAAAGGGAAPVIVNAPSNSSSTKTNVTNVSKSLGHPSPVINAINAAA